MGSCFADSQPLILKNHYQILATTVPSQPPKPVKFNLSKTAADYPYNCIGLLVMHKSSKERVIATGFLIAPNLVLTAAHAIFDTTFRNRKHQKIIFYPGVENYLSEIIDPVSINPSKNTKPDKIEMQLAQYKNQQFYKIKVSDQYALVLLNQEIVRDQYIMLGYNYNEINLQAQVCGYPIHKNRQIFQKPNPSCKQYKQKGKICKVTDETLVHDVKTQEGNSGSPIIIQFFQGVYLAVGIHCKKKRDQETNLACRLSTEKVLQIRKWALELMEANKQTFLAQDFQRYKMYIQNTLCIDFKGKEDIIKNVQKGIDEVNNQQEKHLLYELKSKEDEIDEERTIKDNNSFLNIISYHIQAATVQIKLNKYEEARARMEQCLKDIKIQAKQQQQFRYADTLQPKQQQEIMYEHEANIYTVLGNIQHLQECEDKAIKYFEKAEQIYKHQQMKEGLIQIYEKKAISYLSLGELDKALQLYLQAQKITLQIQQNRLKRAHLHVSIGNTLQLYIENRAEQAKRRYEISLKLFQQQLLERIKNDKKELKDNDGKVLACIKSDSALQIHYFIGCCHYNLGKCYLSLQKCLQALNEFKKAFDSFSKAKFAPNIKFHSLVQGFSNQLSRYIKSKIRDKILKNEPVVLEDRQAIIVVMKQVLDMFEQNPERMKSLLHLFKQLSNNNLERKVIKLEEQMQQK